MRRCESCFETGYHAGEPVDVCTLCGGPVKEGSFAVNHGQRLYLIPHLNARGKESGYSCLGFEYAEQQRRAVLEWLNREHYSPDASAALFGSTPAEPGTPEAFRAHSDAMAAGAEFSRRTGKRCPAELTPELIGLEGKRVEVKSPDGSTRRFWVGKSTGWCPCHLEIATRASSGGGAAYIPKGSTVRVIDSGPR